jgi:hypothetical protein
MGGFQLFKRSDQSPHPISGEKNRVTQDLGSFVRILDIQDVLQHELGTVVPLTTEEEIKDKGKSDGIGKFIVLLQTSWFIIQCIARGIKHLPLTELEIVTLAYAMMNFFVYIFWWDKPCNVGCPIRVYENLTTSDTEGGEVTSIFKKILNYTIGSQDRCAVLSQESKVPMLWSGGTESGDSVDFVAMRAALGPSVLGIAFGAMHCIAWSYYFPSHAELVLWRASSVGFVCSRRAKCLTNACILPIPTSSRTVCMAVHWRPDCDNCYRIHHLTFSPF